MENLVLLRQIHLQGSNPNMIRQPVINLLEDRLEFMDFRFSSGVEKYPILFGLLHQSKNCISFEYNNKDLQKFCDKERLHDFEILTMVRKGRYIVTLSLDGTINVITLASLSSYSASTVASVNI